MTGYLLQLQKDQIRGGCVGHRTMEARGVECVEVDYSSINWPGSLAVKAPFMNWGNLGSHIPFEYPSRPWPSSRGRYEPSHQSNQ